MTTTTHPKTETPIPTRHDLSEDVRGPMVTLLNDRLADAIDVALQAKQAHWNVKGPSFQALHELFDAVHDEARAWVDGIAERAVQLGGVADGTLQAVATRTTIPAYPLELRAGVDHADALSQRLSAFAKQIRAAIDAAAEAGDQGTADLFTEVVRGVDEKMWFVEAHLHADR